MKKPFLTIATFILMYSFSFAQTIISAGNVSGTWTFAGSPYLIQGAIMIPNDSSLTIEPGVTVNFQGSYKLYVQGRLLAIGAVADTITFIAADSTIGWLEYNLTIHLQQMTLPNFSIANCNTAKSLAVGEYFISIISPKQLFPTAVSLIARQIQVLAAVLEFLVLAVVRQLFIIIFPTI